VVPQLRLRNFWHFCSCPVASGLCGCVSLVWRLILPSLRLLCSFTDQASSVCSDFPCGRCSPGQRRVWGTAPSWDSTSAESLYEGFFTRVASHSPLTTYSPFGMQK